CHACARFLLQFRVLVRLRLLPTSHSRISARGGAGAVAQACPHENKTIDSRSPPEVDARSLVTTTGGAAMSSAPVRCWTPCRRLPILQSHLRLLWPICCVLLQVSAARDLLAGGN